MELQNTIQAGGTARNIGQRNKRNPMMNAASMTHLGSWSSRGQDMAQLGLGEGRWMADFDREELKAAFESGKIPVSDDNIRRLDALLRAIAQQYRARKVARSLSLETINW
jgi:hypothetical protein